MALINCPECQRTVSDMAPSCPQCGYPIASMVTTSGRSDAPSATTQSQQGAIEDSGLPEYYRQRFDAFDAFEGGRTVFWNWASFLLGPIWYLAKGMWLKPLAYFVVLLVAVLADAALIFVFIVPTVFSIYAGQYGTYDFYRYHRNGEQW